eukprot:jgi/Tetstr1/423608/TSEL_001380.t1
MSPCASTSGASRTHSTLSVQRSVFSKLFGGRTSPAAVQGGSFHSRYELGRVLGSGSFAVARIAIDRATGKEWACKVVTETADRTLQLEEVNILRQLDHPNLLKYREHFDEPDHLYIISELLSGASLLPAILERGCYPEDDAREVMRQLLSALAYLDSKGIAHRDLTLENIMLVSEASHTRIKIIDFGLSAQLSSSRPAFREGSGTPQYLAPEVVKLIPYGPKCDVWAAGLVLFVLLSGDYPYTSSTAARLIARIRRLKYVKFKDPVWEITSESARDMVRALLTVEPAERPAASAALAHRWMCDKGIF